jgi:hypothetical protein
MTNRPPTLRDLFDEAEVTPRPLMLKVTPAARVTAQAIENIGRRTKGIFGGATEQEIVRECRRMKEAGEHSFDAGFRTNPRNRLQRACAGSKIYRETWGPKGYAAIFIRVPGSPARWKLVPGFKPNLAGKVIS